MSWKFGFDIVATSILIVVLFQLYSIYGTQTTEMSRLIGLDFEIYGRVQGVFFRKYTQKRSKELGLHGWCMNTAKGTVVGHIEGEQSKIEEMKYWLQHTGSPESEIDKADFNNEKEITDYSLPDFTIRR